MDLIARIGELLDERGWSKYQLAKEAKLSQSTILSMMKRGNNPTVYTIERCCVHTAVTSGSWCGGQRQLCGDSGSGLI